ncbi:hypothetical protein ACEUUF_12085 [Staphylococcus pseudintermedius]|nr:hypothetical protein [Staphylococcus pseudintermedius]
MSMFDEVEENERKRVKYLVEHKDYVTCLNCGGLISPSEKGMILLCVNLVLNIK